MRELVGLITRKWWLAKEVELAVVAALARRLILGQTTLAGEFPGYRYGRQRWLGEQVAR